MDRAPFFCSELPHPLVRGQIRLLGSTKGLQNQETAKSLPAVQLITDKAQDPLPQLVV